jgi:hypothetical protein
MKLAPPSPAIRAFLFVILAALLTPALRAQAPIEAAQLPARTSFYALWRGTPTGDARKSNALFSLWDDADFAPVRAAIFENMTSASTDNKDKDASKPPLTRAEAEEYSTLLDNGFVLGYMSKPDSKITASATPPKASATPGNANAGASTWNGLFFVYNRAGKEALLSKAVLRMRAEEKELPQISQVTIAGVPALKVERKSGTTYWIEHGKYAAGANEPSVLEQILPRLEGKSNSNDANSLGQSPAWQEAQPHLGGVLEIFGAIPALRNLAPDNAQGFKLGPVLTAIKLDAIRSISGHVALDGAKTRFQGVILGDNTPGSILDFWSAGTDSPPSLAVLPPNAISYSESQFDLPALYQVIKRGVAAIAPGGQNPAMMLEMVAQSKLGMPLADALALPTGEFTSMQLSPALDPQKSTYLFGIHKKPEMLKLLRTILSDQISSERNEGDVTYLKISLHGKQGAQGTAQWDFYHLAVTPDFIYGAPTTDALHEALAGRDTMRAAVLMPYQAARADYPAKINGLYFFDFQKVDWPAAKQHWIDEAQKTSEKQTATPAQKAAANKVPSVLANADPKVFARHLHYMAGASWKDEKGIHFDQWLN